MIVKRSYLLLLLILIVFLTGCPPRNRPPVWDEIGGIVKNIGELLQINLADYCTDPDGDFLTFKLVGGLGSVSGSLYQWNVVGPFGPTTVTVRAEDTNTNKSETSFIITVKSLPNVPSSPSPANGSTNENHTVTLTWSGGDPDGDLVVYDLYLSTSPNPTLFISNRTTTSYQKGGLLANTTYYWKIVARDTDSNQVAGPIWNFKTKP